MINLILYRLRSPRNSAAILEFVTGDQWISGQSETSISLPVRPPTPLRESTGSPPSPAIPMNSLTLPGETPASDSAKSMNSAQSPLPKGPDRLTTAGSESLSHKVPANIPPNPLFRIISSNYQPFSDPSTTDVSHNNREDHAHSELVSNIISAAASGSSGPSQGRPSFDFRSESPLSDLPDDSAKNNHMDVDELDHVDNNEAPQSPEDMDIDIGDNTVQPFGSLDSTNGDGEQSETSMMNKDFKVQRITHHASLVIVSLMFNILITFFCSRISLTGNGVSMSSLFNGTILG